jgi:tRNA G46 methylase TrmB
MFGIVSLLSFCSQKNAHFPVRRLHTNLYLEDIYNIDVTEMHPKTVDTALKHCETYKRYASKSICAEHTGVAFSRASQFIDDFYKSKGADIDKKYVILDSGCGAGMSTVCLALLYPDLPVIGIDRSIARLSRNKKIEIKNQISIRDNFDLYSKSREAIPTNGNENSADDGVEDTFDISPTDNDNDIINESSEESTITQLKPNAILLRAELSDLFTLISSKSDWIIHSHYLLYPNPYPKSKHLQRRWHGHPIFPVILALGKSVSIYLYIYIYTHNKIYIQTHM